MVGTVNIFKALLASKEANRDDRTELSRQHMAAWKTEQRKIELAKDPSSIPGMTQTELNEVIDKGSISTKLLREIW
jgi:hypothetical protein